jgi:hypothetical protein
MPNQSANGYQGGNSVGSVGFDTDQYISVYNETGSALAAGSVVRVNYANSTTAGLYPQATQVTTVATSTVQIGVVANYLSGGDGTIADKSWGWVQVMGYCEKVLVDGAVTLGHQLQAVTTPASSVYFTATTEATATISTDSFAIAKTAATGATYVTAYLYGRRVTTAAT